MPYYVSNGYLVLEPDIAYKVGYPGQSALKCVLPAVQAIVDKGFVDEDAIGIEGHSWGGYQIAYMITQTNRFRAVEAGAVVANMTSAYDGIRWVRDCRDSFNMSARRAGSVAICGNTRCAISRIRRCLCWIG